MDKGKALGELKRDFEVYVKKYGFIATRWAFRKVVEWNSEKVKLLKKREQLEKDLAEINKKIK